MRTLGKSVKSCSIVCLFSRQWKLRIKVNVRGLIRTPTTNFYSIASYSLDQLYSIMHQCGSSFVHNKTKIVHADCSRIGMGYTDEDTNSCTPNKSKNNMPSVSCWGLRGIEDQGLLCGTGTRPDALSSSTVPEYVLGLTVISMSLYVSDLF